jgi:hypothetical protein
MGMAGGFLSRRELRAAWDGAKRGNHGGGDAVAGAGDWTAIFSLVDTVMLRALPVNEPSQLVLFGNGLDKEISDGFPNRWLYSYPFYC